VDDDIQTCGKGLAEHSALPAKAAELFAAMAENLLVHVPTLDITDDNAARERDAYASLAEGFRAVADRLAATAQEMAGYRDLPMARHHVDRLASPEIMTAFQHFVVLEEGLLDVARRAASRDRAMLDAIPT
jgi:hypothetical protein